MKKIAVLVMICLSVQCIGQIYDASNTSSSSVDAYTKSQSDARYATPTDISTAISEIEVTGGTDSSTVNNLIESALQDTLNNAVEVVPLTTFNAYKDSLNTVIANLLNALNQISGIDLVAPSVDSIEIGRYNDSIFIVFMDTTDLNQDSIPSINSFAASEDGNTFGLASVTISNDSVLVTADSLAEYGSTYLLSYTRPTLSALQDNAGNEVASFNNRAVVNNISEPAAELPAAYSDGNTEGDFSASVSNFTLEGTLISQWNDISGSVNHLTQTGDFRPNWDAANSEVDFALDDFIQRTVALSQPLTIYMVVRQNSRVNASPLMYLSTDVYTNIQQGSVDGRITAYAGETIYTDGATLSQYGVLIVQFNGANSLIQWNDNAAATGDAGTGGINRIRIGADGTTAEMSVKRVMVRNAIDNEATRTAFINYLNSTYTIF